MRHARPKVVVGMDLIKFAQRQRVRGVLSLGLLCSIKRRVGWHAFHIAYAVTVELILYHEQWRLNELI